MQKRNIKCSECEFCKDRGRPENSRPSFWCEHPDTKYIADYFSHHRIQKMEGFLCFGKPWSHEVTIKTSPAWCPKKAD